jgi:membrane-bound lytic murein transglycosylase B
VAGLTGVSPGSAGLAEAPAANAIDLQRFAAWRTSFRAKALAAGISPETFDKALGKVAPNPSVMQADQRQPESTKTIWDYLDSAVSAKRVATGQDLSKQHIQLLSRVTSLYGVAPQYIVAIWGLESNFGVNTGGYNVFEALATLAFDGRRSAYAERELIAALKIADRGDKAPADMTGSWAGAMGQTQFTPSAYLDYAVDEDGDGHRDLFSSVPDIIASIANFLGKSGWRKGEIWGEEVVVPRGFDYSAADPTITQDMSTWRKLSIRTVKGAHVPGGPHKAALFLPGGYRGPAFLLYDNFSTILRYNNSTSYGLAVGTLADRLKGAAPIKASWPREERALSLAERKEVQDLLNRLGYEVGEVDGILGAQTRLALKAYQRKIGQPADGFATVALLEHLRATAPAAPPAATTPPGPAPGTSPN